MKNTTSIPYLILLFLCALPLFSFSQTRKTFDFNDNCHKAYQHLISLRLEKGKALIARELQENPTNAIPHFLGNYADMFHTFISEEDAALKELEVNKDKRLKIIEQADKSSPYYLFTKAEIKLQSALARIKFEQYMKAFWEIRKAYKLLEKNAR